METLHTILCFLLVLCGYFVGFSSTPINSVLFLILSFCNAAVIFFLFSSEFLGLTLIIVYVGAIAVLFLFVIMMLDIKKSDKKIEKSKFLPQFGLFNFSLLLAILYLFLTFTNFNSFSTISSLESFQLLHILENINNIDLLGQILYNYYLPCVLIAGLLLLVALIGAIILTLRFNLLEKHQLTFRQLSRTNSFISFFK